MANSKSTGFQWYFFDWFGAHASPSDLTLNSDGSASMVNGPYNANIVTGLQISGTTWVGTAFGGGAYFEAEIAFDPLTAINDGGWPAFWALPTENLMTTTYYQQWPGQATGYDNHVELDIMEFLFADGPCILTNGIVPAACKTSGGMHNWYGIQYSTCPTGFCDVPGGGDIRPH